MGIKFTESEVENYSQKLYLANEKIYDEYSNVTSVLAKLNESWVSSASDISMQRQAQIKNSFLETRYDQFTTLIDFLRNVVTAIYNSTEDSVVKDVKKVSNESRFL